MRRAFTLIELLVVVAMLAILTGSIGSSVNQARKRAQVAKATQDAKEITNAILAFQNYARNHSLANYVTGSWRDATKSSLSMIMGGETGDNGGEVPVLYNAQLTGAEIRDPWGTPYQFIIKKLSGISSASKNTQYLTAPNLPNFYRLTDEERQ